MMQKAAVRSGFYARLLALIGLLVAMPAVTVFFYPNEARYLPSFLLPAGIFWILSLIMAVFGRKDTPPVGWQETLSNSSRIVLFAWCAGLTAGALPFFLSGQLDPIQALFESVSGWTTTGLSVMDVSATPRIFLFHRGFMQFCGGLGFILMMLLFVQGKQAMNLYSAEGHPDKLMPSLAKTAWTIFLMYLFFLLLGTVAYLLCGMPAFDSLLHAMCSLSTGGFSTQANSIASYQSVGVEAVTIALMLIGTSNFAVLLLLIRRRFRRALRVSEVRFLFVLLLLAVPAVTASLYSALSMSVGESVRASVFNVVSALSTTGYSTMSYQDWPPFSVGMLIVLMLIGGGIGSTAGGLKLTRVYLLFRIMLNNIRQRIYPSRRVFAPSYYRAQGKSPIDAPLIGDTIGFAGCYLFLFLVGSLLLTLTEGCSLMDAMFEFASSLGTVGLSIGLTHPGTGAATLIVEMCGMLLGRLEIFIVFFGICSGISGARHGMHRLLHKCAAKAAAARKTEGTQPHDEKHCPRGSSRV